MYIPRWERVLAGLYMWRYFYISYGYFYIPAASRKQVVSHFPSEERSSDEKGKAFASGTVRSEADELVNVFPFPNSRRKVCEDKEINAVQEFRGTAKLFSSPVLSLWLGVVGLMAHLWG